MLQITPVVSKGFLTSWPGINKNKANYSKRYIFHSAGDSSIVKNGFGKHI
jgi:hypothetical protein